MSEAVAKDSWLGWFLAGMTPGDWVNACLLLVGILTLLWTARSLRLQSKAQDFASFLSLSDRFSTAWRRFRQTSDDDWKRYEFAEILNLIESACHFYNKGALHGVTRDVYGLYLKEVIRDIHKNDFAVTTMKEALSGPDTFFHIRRFARMHDIEGAPHQ
ncbi:MAG: hypothetical protein E5X48_14060 [Mesorhizobium sp.]|nr:MAG: hypothetical protein E5X48_14060 [Mesorhizobium sp.]